ncbi:hypothetical protein OE766_05445 [Pararhizobium sp. YC-54]|uniref:phage tail assembly chaperone n=1 Tax=Pararhizobium sp. YC-54 TaxID=2986920 RepID=UPI0021F797C1|nr:hypothetical protein [Pararhizobium sp. YC-54]MCV9997684.1 hypothetical protein [Pararhizobium sp. YC-54]
MRIQRLLVDALRTSLQTGKAPQLPAGGDLPWRWFLDLNRTRTWHAAGPHALSYNEIEAYCRVRRWPLQQHHIDVLLAMDDAYLEHVRSSQASAQGGGKAVPKAFLSKAAPAALDAVFGW